MDAKAISARDGASPGSLPLDDTVREMRQEKAPAFSTVRTILPHAEGRGSAMLLVDSERSRYVPIRPLGAGGMGEVTLVLDQDIGRLVAVKRLPADVDSAAVLRFVDEIRTLGQLEHPNIVPIHDVGVDDEGRYFFVMKYVEGETLASIIHRLREGDPLYHQRYPFERRAAIFIDVLRALSAAHARGVLHRDVKPSNVMVGHGGEVVVLDWGIAKSRASVPRPAVREPVAERSLATRAGELIGTPPYMSPEQAMARNDALDERSDLYSATALFHELLTLEHYLGERDSSAETLVAVMLEEVSFRRLVEERRPGRPAPPAELLRVVAKGLSKDPAERFQSAQQMIDVLESALEARSAVTRQVDSARRKLRGLGLLVTAHLHLAILVVGMSLSRIWGALW